MVVTKYELFSTSEGNWSVWKKQSFSWFSTRCHVFFENKIVFTLLFAYNLSLKHTGNISSVWLELWDFLPKPVGRENKTCCVDFELILWTAAWCLIFSSLHFKQQTLFKTLTKFVNLSLPWFLFVCTIIRFSKRILEETSMPNQ